MSYTTTAAPSKVLTDKRDDQIEEALPGRPYEAVTLAKRLLDDYPEDEKVLATFFRTCLRAQALTGNRHLTDEWCDMAEKIAEARFFSPVFSVLGVAARVSRGGSLDDDSLASLKRAYRMGPEVVPVLVKDLIPLFGISIDEFRRMVCRGKI